jgi:hypothetical protein
VAFSDDIGYGGPRSLLYASIAYRHHETRSLIQFSSQDLPVVRASNDLFRDRRCRRPDLLAWILRMLDQIIQVGLRLIFALVVLMMFINYFYMIFSPTSWFALPNWLRLQGVLTIERYGKGWGAIQIRILSAIISATISWVGFDMLR